MNATVEQIYCGYLGLTDGDKAAAASLTLADTLLTVARRLRISGQTAYELLQGGQTPFFRVGRSLRVKPNDLETYIDEPERGRSPGRVGPSPAT